MDDVNHIDEFRDREFIATKVPGNALDLEGNSIDLCGKSDKEIREILSQPPYELDSLRLGNTTRQLDFFVNQMQEGDLVLVPDGPRVHFARIESPYTHATRCRADDNAQEFSPFLTQGEEIIAVVGSGMPCSQWFPHWRRVSWLQSTSRESLSSELRKQLMNHRQIGNLSKFYAEIKALSNGETFDQKQDLVQVSYPLRPDFDVKFTVPSDITRTEARRLAQLVAISFYADADNL